jgi:hypothetical protein
MTFCILKAGRKVMKAASWDWLIPQVHDRSRWRWTKGIKTYEELIDAVVPVGVELADAKLESSEPVK